MLKKFTYLILINSFILISACKSVNVVNKEDMHTVSHSIFGDKVDYVFNADSTKVICIGNKQKRVQYFSFFVYSLKNNQKVTEVFNHVEYVNWKDLNTIEYSFLSGNVKYGSSIPDNFTLKIDN